MIILVVVTLLGLITASVTDIRTREVPDWLSYGLIITGVGLNLLFAFIYSDYWFIINSLAGLLLFLIIALVMFYAGQWGGGDSKVLMGIGALMGLNVRITGFPFLISFLINALLIGAIYGLMWSLILAFRNRRNFLREFRRISHSANIIRFRIYIFAFAVLMIVLFISTTGSVFSSFFLALLLIVLLTFYLWIFVKAIEKTCMIKEVKPDRLTEGDWIVKEIRHKGEYICGPKDLGIEKKQIRKLVELYRKKKIRKVLVKEGIPFVPSFLIAFIVSLFVGNLMLWVI